MNDKLHTLRFYFLCSFILFLLIYYCLPFILYSSFLLYFSFRHGPTLFIMILLYLFLLTVLPCFSLCVEIHPPFLSFTRLHVSQNLSISFQCYKCTHQCKSSLAHLHTHTDTATSLSSFTLSLYYIQINCTTLAQASSVQRASSSQRMTLLLLLLPRAD